MGFCCSLLCKEIYGCLSAFVFLSALPCFAHLGNHAPIVGFGAAAVAAVAFAWSCRRERLGTSPAETSQCFIRCCAAIIVMCILGLLGMSAFAFWWAVDHGESLGPHSLYLCGISGCVAVVWYAKLLLRILQRPAPPLEYSDTLVGSSA